MMSINFTGAGIENFINDALSALSQTHQTIDGDEPFVIVEAIALVVKIDNAIDVKALTSQKLEIKLEKDIEEKYKKLLPSRAENALDHFYLEVNQGVMRAKVRIDIYEAWMNPDLTVETRNEMVSLIWRIDGVENNEEKRKWLKKHENHLRNYATESWVRLRYQAL